jgi:hypothetical protein
VDALLALPKALVDIAVKLFRIKKDDRTKQRLADLLAQVAECVERVAANIYDGIHDPSVCSELDVYIDQLYALVAKEIDEETAFRVTFLLKHVDEAPTVVQQNIGSRIYQEAKPKITLSGRFQQSQSVREIAGTIRGIANLVRV